MPSRLFRSHLARTSTPALASVRASVCTSICAALTVTAMVVSSATAGASPASLSAESPAAESLAVSGGVSNAIGIDGVGNSACTQRMQKALTSVLQASGVNSFGGIVHSAGNSVVGNSAKPVWQSNADRALAPASITKLLTASAALHTLQPTKRQETGVYLAIDGSLVLRGTGDVTLSRRATAPTFYTNAARISDLAQQVSHKVKYLPIKPKRLIVDTSFYTGPDMARGWDRWDIGGGSIAPIVPAMLDGGRIHDAGWYSPHTPTPSLQVGATLAQYLGIDGLKIEVGKPPLALLPLGKVHSAPLRDRLHDMLIHSDNVLAESIGREVASEMGHPASFRGAADAVIATVGSHNVPTRGAVLEDTSGLSSYDRLAPRTIEETLRPHNLSEKRDVTDIIRDNLPVAGESGTLRYRFGGENAAARGHIRAKTGSLNNVSTLAGIAYSARSNTPYYFAFLVNDTVYWLATMLVDNLAATVYRTGC